MNLSEIRAFLGWVGFGILVLAALSGIEPTLRALLP